MSEMLERAERAIYAQIENGGDSDAYVGKFRQGELVVLDGEWNLRLIAKAVLAALREPTTEMEVAGTELWLTIAAQEDRAKSIWQAMIDEALR